MCPPPFFKTSTPFIITVINETLWEFLPLGDYRSLQFFHGLELSLVSLPNSVIHAGLISGLFEGHMWGSMKLMCSFSDSPSWSGSVRWRSILLQCPPGMMTYFSDVRQHQTLLEDDIAVVWAVNVRSRIDEDHPCLPNTRYSDRHRDVATEVFPFT